MSSIQATWFRVPVILRDISVKLGWCMMCSACERRRKIWAEKQRKAEGKKAVTW